MRIIVSARRPEPATPSTSTGGVMTRHMTAVARQMRAGVLTRKGLARLKSIRGPLDDNTEGEYVNDIFIIQ